MGAAGGDAPRRRASPDRAAAGRSEARALEAELAGSVVELQSARERAEPVAATATTTGADGLPVQGPRVVRRRRRRVLLRARAARRRAGRAARRRAAARRSSARRAAASRRSLRAGLLPALAGGVLPGSERWAQARDPPGRAPAARARARDRAARARAAPRAGRRPVRGAVHGLPRRGRARRVRRRARRAPPATGTRRRARRVRADFYGRCAAYPELSRLLGANHVLVGPMRARRAAPRDRAARAARRPARRARARRRAARRRRGRAGRAAAAVDRAARAVAASATAGACASPPTSAAAASTAPSRGSPRTPTTRLDPEQQADRPQRSCCGSPARARAARSCAARSRSPSSSGDARRRGRRAARRPPAAHGRRGRGRGRARGAAARVAAAARLAGRGRRGPAPAPPPAAPPRASGTPTAATRASSTAARGWPPRSTGRPATTAELNADRARVPGRRAGRASERAQRRLRLVLAGVAALLVLAVIAGVVALDQRGNARAEATAADAQRLGAQALAEDDLDRSLLLARQGVALDDSPQTRGNLLAALLKSPAAIGVLRGDGDRLIEPRPQPRRAHAGVPRQRRHAEPSSTAHAAPGRRRRRADPGFIGGPVAVDVVRFSHDGSRLAVGGQQPVVLDARTASRARRCPRRIDGSIVTRCASRRTARTLFADARQPAECASTTIQRFDARSGRPLGEPQRVTPPRRQRDADGHARRPARRDDLRRRSHRDPRRAHAAPAAKPARSAATRRP